MGSTSPQSNSMKENHATLAPFGECRLPMLAVDLVSSPLDAATNHQWARAPDEGIQRTDLHKRLGR